MTLADAIQQAHEANEKRVGAGIAIPVQFDADAALSLDPFNRFAAFHGCKNCPAAPKVVAAWVRSEKDTDPNKIIGTLSVIELLHDVHGLSNPVATSVVRAELEKVLNHLEAPRSWSRQDQLRWAALPAEMRGIICKRERDRERWLRNKMNELAELKRQLSGAETKPAATTEETKNVTEAK